MSKDLVLFTRDAGDTIQLLPEAESMKVAALEKGALVGKVDSEATNQEACVALKSLKSVIDLTEKTRKAVKAPVLDLGRLIDKVADNFAVELKDEFSRISRACADFQTAQLERVREQERRRAEEAARIERERQAELAKIEQERREAEAAAKAKADAEIAAARCEADRKEAEDRAKAEAERIAAAAQAAAQVTQERAAQAVEMRTPAPGCTIRAVGQMVRPVWEFEVTDIYALCRANPMLVEITPRRGIIKETIESMATGGNPPKIPGLRIWSEVKVGVRKDASPATINV